GTGGLDYQRRGEPSHRPHFLPRTDRGPRAQPPPAAPTRRLRVPQCGRFTGCLRPAQGPGHRAGPDYRHRGHYYFYYEDPDRNIVELFADNFGDWRKSTEFMRTSPEFAARPIGNFVDPDAMIAARASGVSAKEVHRRAYAGEFPPSKPMGPPVLM